MSTALLVGGHALLVGLTVPAAACADHPRLRRPVAVNVSALQLEAPGFVDEVLDALGGCPADALVLEVTESVLMDDVAGVAEVLHRLRDAGIRIALDDFGTSWSSLGVLARLPVDVVKIDRSFVCEVLTPAGRSVGAAVVALARALGATTVAEGVETAEELDAVTALGADHVQGWLTGRPAPVDVWDPCPSATVAPPAARVVPVVR